MKERSRQKKIGFDIRWIFRLSVLVGISYLWIKLSTNIGVLVFGGGLVAFGVIGLIVTSRMKRHRPDAFEYFYLIDAFVEWGMADNDFYILRETVDLFEERGADAHLVTTLREMMGKKDDMEIGWTLV